MKSRILLIVGVCLAGMSLVFGVSAAVLAVQTSAFLSSAEPVTGVVTALDEQRVSSSSNSSNNNLRRDRYTYHPVVAFEVGGEEHTFTGRAGSDPPRYDVGEQVDVLYNPDNPSDARLTAGFAYWLELSFGLAAVVLLVVGGALIAAWSRAAARSSLARTGDRATGTVTRARTSSNVTFNRRPRTETTVTWRHPFAGELTFTEKGWGAQHAVGDEVVVRHDADRPARAVIEPTAPLDPPSLQR